MSIQGLLHIKKAISNLNPEQVRLQAARSLRIGIRAGSSESFTRIENFFLRDLSPERRLSSSVFLVREYTAPQQLNDFTVYDEGITAPIDALIFRTDNPDLLVRKILARHEDLGVALARAFLPFRHCFVQKVISSTCKENTLFALATALPDVIPSLIELPWAVAEFATDTAFLTMNQIKMAFLIAAASDREVGYRQQKAEVASIIAGGFGWRALARELVGKIPFGGGLIGKSAIAYAGTKVVGISLERFYSIGYKYSREDREKLYQEAFRQGRTVAAKILGYLRPDLAAKQAPQEARSNAIDIPSRASLPS